MDLLAHKNNKYSGIAELFEERGVRVYLTGYHLTYIMGIMVLDRADIGVSTKLDFD